MYIYKYYEKQGHTIKHWHKTTYHSVCCCKIVASLWKKLPAKVSKEPVN